MFELIRVERRGPAWYTALAALVVLALSGYVAAGKAGHERPAFPDGFLPAEVLKRRAGQTPGKKTWAPPSKAEARPAEETPKARRN